MIAISMIGICSANDTRCHSQRIADLLLRDGLASLLRPIWCGPFGRLRLFADGSRYAEVIDLGGHCGILRRWHHILLKYSERLQGRLASRLIEVVPLLRVVKSRPQQFALLGSVATCRSFESRWLDSMNLLRQFSCDNFQVFELGTFAYQSLTSLSDFNGLWEPFSHSAVARMPQHQTCRGRYLRARPHTFDSRLFEEESRCTTPIICENKRPNIDNSRSRRKIPL